MSFISMNEPKFSVNLSMECYCIMLYRHMYLINALLCKQFGYFASWNADTVLWLTCQICAACIFFYMWGWCVVIPVFSVDWGPSRVKNHVLVYLSSTTSWDILSIIEFILWWTLRMHWDNLYMDIIHLFIHLYLSYEILSLADSVGALELHFNFIFFKCS